MGGRVILMGSGRSVGGPRRRALLPLAILLEKGSAAPQNAQKPHPKGRGFCDRKKGFVLAAQTSPWASMASATLRKPAMLAPATRL